MPDLSIPFYVSYAALWILVILQRLILLGVVRIVYQLQKNGVTSSRNVLSQGQEAPQFSAVDLSGAPVSSTDFAGHLTALLFISPDCRTCVESLEKDMEYLRYKAQGNLIVICKAGREDCTQLAEKYELNLPMVADEDDRISRLFAISSVPTAVLINADNRIQSYGQPEREEPEKELTETGEAEVPVAG